MGAVGFACGRCARVRIVYKDLCTSALRAPGCVRDAVRAPPVHLPTQPHSLGGQGLILLYSTYSEMVGRTGEDFGVRTAKRQLA